MTPEELAKLEAQLFKGWRTAQQVHDALDVVKARILELAPYQTPKGMSRTTWLCMARDLLNAELKKSPIEEMAGALPELVSDPNTDPDTIAVPKAVYAEVLARLAYLTEFVIFSGDLHDALVRDHERLKMCRAVAGEAPKGTEEEGSQHE
jgi:hypothetical protein